VLSGIVICGGCHDEMWVGSRDATRPIYKCSTYTTRTACPAPTTILAEPLEKQIVSAYLRDWGAFPLQHTVMVVDDSAVTAARNAHKAATAAIAADPTSDNLTKLQAATEALRAAESSLPEPVRVVRDSGRTLADEWNRLTHVADKRAALATVLPAIVVCRPGTGDRVDWDWSPDPLQFAE
jgi:hypothetical protein